MIVIFCEFHLYIHYFYTGGEKFEQNTRKNIKLNVRTKLIIINNQKVTSLHVVFLFVKEEIVYNFFLV